MDERIDQLPALVESVIASYYSKDYAPLLERCVDDCVFIGAGSDLFSTKADMMRALATPEDAPLLLMRNADFRLANQVDQDQREAIVLGTYHLYTAPNEPLLFAARQRISVFCRLEDGIWKTYHVHSSNEWSEPVDEEAFPYQVSKDTYEYVRSILRTGRKAGLLPTRIALEGGARTTYIDPVHVACFQADGKRSIAHTTDGSVEIAGLLRDIEPQLPGTFVRVHRSYVVNAACVTSVRHFVVELSNGMEVPVPERRFAEVNREISLRLGTA